MDKKFKFSFKDVFRWLVLIVCGLILGINIYLANANSLVGNQLPMPFGYGAAVVMSGSMEPELSKGDLIIVKEENSFVKNQIVVFQDENHLVVHRIIDVDKETITTKGDANNVADKPIDISAIKGTVLFWVPYVGNIVSLLKTPAGTFSIIAVAIVLIELPNIAERKKDDEERDKLIEEIKKLKEELKD